MSSHHYMRTMVGALVLMLVATGCASKSGTAKASQRGTASADRSATTTTDARTAAADQKAAQGRVANEGAAERPETERMVPSDRTGSSNPTAVDQATKCADERGDMTSSMNCMPGSRDDRTALNRSGYSDEALTACKHRTDTSGHIIFEDLNCAKRYRADTAMGASYQNVDIARESAYFDRYMDKAVKHAKQAEIAAGNGHGAEMMRHAELALDNAKEAQRAGNVPGLPQGIAELRETLEHGQGRQWADSTSHATQARIHLSQAAGLKVKDARVAGPRTASTAGSAVANRRTLSGELVGDESAAMRDGNRQYVLRDQSGQETPIWLPADMSQNVKSGDHVQAVLDQDGRVVAINKE